MNKIDKRIKEEKAAYAYGDRFHQAFFGENLTPESPAMHINWLLVLQYGKDWLEEVTGQTFA